MSAAAPGTIDSNGVPIVGWDKDGFPICAEKEFTESVIIAAQPGWSAIIHPGCEGCGGDEWWSLVTPVIAWRIVTNRFHLKGSAQWTASVSTIPIVTEASGVAEPDGAAIVLPDGTVEDFLHGRFDSREEWEEAARKWWEKNNQPKNADGE